MKDINTKKMLDMTEGTPWRLLMSFTIPMLIGNLFQQLYNMVDSIVVGQYVGANALGAVGATGSINFFFFSFSFGMSAGVGVMVAQYFGARDDDSVKRTIANAIYVICAISLLMSVVGVVFARPILEFLDTPAKILDDAVVYMQVSCAGIVAIAMYNGVSAILRALGDSKTPLLFLIVASVVNVMLDLVFVVAFNWSVFGVALATIIAQIIAAIGCIIYAYRKIDYFKIPRSYYKPDRDLIIKCIKIGVPVSLQNSLIALSCIALQKVVNGFGEVVVSAFTATGRFEQLIQQPFTSLGAAVVTYTGQNIGAGQVDRVKKGFRSASLMCLAFSILMLPVAYFGAEGIMRIFIRGTETDVIRIGMEGLRITAFFYFPLGMIYVSRSILNGAGDTSAAMLNGIVEVAGRVGFAKPLTMVPQIGTMAAWFTTGLTWLITAIISCARYFGGKWKGKGITQGSKPVK